MKLNTENFGNKYEYFKESKFYLYEKFIKFALKIEASLIFLRGLRAFIISKTEKKYPFIFILYQVYIV